MPWDTWVNKQDHSVEYEARKDGDVYEVWKDGTPLGRLDATFWESVYEKKED